MTEFPGIRHFGWLPSPLGAQLFYQAPMPVRRDADIGQLAMALGATLYMPATRPTISRDLPVLATRGVTSAVLCLEDAIPDTALAAAEANLARELRTLADAFAGNPDPLPLTFVRVREPSQMGRVLQAAGAGASLIAGFVLPKFDPDAGRTYLDEIERLSTATATRYLSMPVLESAPVLHLETRQTSLVRIRDLLAEYRDQVLAVRIGAADLLAPYGLRRTRDITAYEMPLLAQALGDIVNVLGRVDTGHIVTGPVWEYFSAAGPAGSAGSAGAEVAARVAGVAPLHHLPTVLRDIEGDRLSLLASDIGGLIREAFLDRANGLTGKTVIHPSHVVPVQALSVVPFEEYKDALDVIGGLSCGGVMASSFGNKMNEGKPHTAWARRTVLRAQAFGVAAHGVTFVDFIQAGRDLLGSNRPIDPGAA